MEDQPQYQQWIAAHQPTDPRGQCAPMTTRMAEAFPELRRVRGHYVCPLEGRRPHWWLVTPSGRIIDPTVDQFASCGMGDYEEYAGPEPTGHCLNCGAMVFGPEMFCNADCAIACVEWMKSGGGISVNGRQVWPPES
jgi:hypothetical protein